MKSVVENLLSNGISLALRGNYWVNIKTFYFPSADTNYHRPTPKEDHETITAAEVQQEKAPVLQQKQACLKYCSVVSSWPLLTEPIQHLFWN